MDKSHGGHREVQGMEEKSGLVTEENRLSLFAVMSHKKSPTPLPWGFWGNRANAPASSATVIGC